ncbi:MAG: cysteine methyltransferase [Sneathiella sp.]|nr:MAG: cysteine methyltransferase [Sneathiella sp.]
MTDENKTVSRLSLHQRIYNIVAEIPPGQVATYGQIARIAGCGARVVGYALASLPANRPLCWHRVVNARGEVSLRSSGDSHSRQRRILTEEGVIFNPKGRIDFGQFRWNGPGWIWLEQHGYDPDLPI